MPGSVVFPISYGLRNELRDMRICVSWQGRSKSLIERYSVQKGEITLMA
jgi:hypothetical protein